MCACRFHTNPWLSSFVFNLPFFMLTVCAEPEFGLLNKGGDYYFDVEIRRTLTDHFAVRLSMFDSDGVYQKRENYIRYSKGVKHRASLSTLDWHPFQKHFRMSVGFVAKHHRWNLFAEPMLNRAAGSMDFELAEEDMLRLSHLGGREYVFDRNYLQSILDRINVVDVMLDVDLNKTSDALILEEETIAAILGDIPDRYTLNIPAVNLYAKDISVTANLRFKSFSPYAGIGWGTPPASEAGLYYSLDLGFVYHGIPDVDLALSGVAMLVDDRVTERLERLRVQKQQDLQHVAAQYRMLPYVSFGLRIPF